MNLYNITEAINKTLENKCIILNRNVTPHPKFKAYKVFTYNLYLRENSVNTLILSKQFIKNIGFDEITFTWENCDVEFLDTLMLYIVSSEFKTLMYGI